MVTGTRNNFNRKSSIGLLMGIDLRLTVHQIGLYPLHYQCACDIDQSDL